MWGMKNRTQSELLGKNKPCGIQTKNSYLVFIEISNNHSNKKGQSNHATQEYKNMNIDSMHLYKWKKIRLSIKANESSCGLVQRIPVRAYRPHTMNNNVPHFHPAFQGQNFKQCQHCIAHVVKVKVPRICPVGQKEEFSPWYSAEKHSEAVSITLSTLGRNVYLPLGREARWCSITNS